MKKLCAICGFSKKSNETYSFCEVCRRLTLTSMHKVSKLLAVVSAMFIVAIAATFVFVAIGIGRLVVWASKVL